MSLPYENATSGGAALGLIDISGHRFGKWVVLSYVGASKWECACDCGTRSVVGGAQLRAGKSRGCKKCANVGRAFKHGNASERNGFTPKYRAWLRMKCRVHDRSSPRAKWYAGVPIDPSWDADFSAFDRDVPDPTARDLTLDRINNSLGYVPGNVKWSTMREQARNRRSTRLIEIEGRVQCLAAWAEETGISPRTIMYRILAGNPVYGAFLGQILLPTGQTVLERALDSKLLLSGAAA